MSFRLLRPRIIEPWCERTSIKSIENGGSDSVRNQVDDPLIRAEVTWRILSHSRCQPWETSGTLTNIMSITALG